MNTLNEVLAIVTANSEESIDEFLELLKPEDHTRAEMQEIYEETLGYDPTKYYDIKDLETIVEGLASDDSNIPDEARDYILCTPKDQLVDEAYETFEASRPGFLQAAVESVIEENTGVYIDADMIIEEEDEDDEDDMPFEDPDDEDEEVTDDEEEAD